MSVPVDNYVFLTGRPPIGELLGFIRNMALDGQDADQAALTSEWRTANDHVRDLEKTEAGLADQAPLSPAPAEIQPIIAQVFANPMFQRAYRFVPSEVLLVDLDRLVVFQKFINLAYVETLKKMLSDRSSFEEVARLAFGLTDSQPPVQMMQNSENMFSFICPSNDFRFLEPIMLRPEQIPGIPTTGRPHSLISLVVGFGSNYLNAISFEGRLVLNNGSHRAYALRDLGFKQVPCLVQRVSRRDELDLIAAGDLMKTPDRYLKDRRPPLLKDYFDQKLRKIVQVPRKNRLVRVQFGVEQSDVPAT